MITMFIVLRRIISVCIILWKNKPLIILDNPMILPPAHSRPHFDCPENLDRRPSNL